MFGYIGQLIQRKGLDVLLRAFAKADVPNSRLALVGEGDQRPALVDLARALNIDHRVAFFGYREDRLLFLREFDAFVLPSRLEGIPRCLMEAMAARVPVVATAIPGTTDLVDHGRNGLLFAKDDVDGCATALKAISNRELARRFASVGREYVEKNYSARSMAGSYLALFERLVDPCLVEARV